MRIVKMMMVLAMAVGMLAAAGCGGGGGGGGGGNTEYKMADVVLKNVTSVGKLGPGRFNYQTQQTVEVDISVPFPKFLITVYDQRSRTILDSNGNPAVTQSVELIHGYSSTTSDAQGYHYKESIAIPSAATTIYVVPAMGVYPSSFEVAIVNGKAERHFAKGGV